MVVVHLDHAEPQHSGIESQISFNLGLCGDGAVELYDEVVALEVLGLVFCAGAWQIELAPVEDVADHAGRPTGWGEDCTGGVCCYSVVGERFVLVLDVRYVRSTAQAHGGEVRCNAANERDENCDEVPNMFCDICLMHSG